MMSKYIKLFSNCIPVKGFSQSAICDLQNNEIQLIPNDLFNLLPEFQIKSLEHIKKKFKNKYDDIIDEYVNFLISNGFAFITKTPNSFPKLNLDWFYPFKISNGIIDIKENNLPLYVKIFNEFDKLKCKHLQVRFYVNDPYFFNKILKYLIKIKSIIHSLDLVVVFKLENMKYWCYLINNFPRINSIIFTNCSSDDVIKIKKINNIKILGLKLKFKNIKACGVISKANFAVNIKNFTESLQHNSCLNRKISIDINGDIKNCNSMPETYGNIEDTTLEEAINKPGFKKYWNITKDDIEICKDCEFRYVCTDCRAYTERTKYSGDGLDLSKPLKCGYNPYTNEWAEWSTNPLKQKAIEYYGMQEIIDNDKN